MSDSEIIAKEGTERLQETDDKGVVSEHFFKF